ncbi:MAG: hypothetical protein ABW098_06955 [Candidatus Thiodiazotropha sp.]
MSIKKYNVDHAYATLQSEVDGIEGYIYPTTYTEATKPEGTVKLYRKYHPNWANTDIFPESQLSTMTWRSYTENSGSAWIGYTYLNRDKDSDGVNVILLIY